MVEELTTEVMPEVSKEELIAQMQEAINSGDFKAVSQISSKINKLAVSEEKLELEAKQSVVAELTLKVKGIVDKAVQKLIDAGEMDEADGVWYTNDFEETLTTCKLLKKAVKARTTTGGGAGKKYDITTEQLLEKHGTEIDPKSGKTYQELWNENTDKNSRYQSRIKLLKLNGEI